MRHIGGQAARLIAIVDLSISTGCATIVSRSTYQVPLETNKTTTVEVRNRDELVTTVMAPTTIALTSRGGFFVPARYTFTFKQEGYPDVVKERGAYLNAWYLGNIIFGGLIGILIVDPATGAMWRLDETPLGVKYNVTQSGNIGGLQ